MKKYTFLLLFFLTMINVYGQSLSFNELKSMRSKSYSEIDKVLKDKSWSFDNKTIKSTYTKYQWNYSESPIGVFVFIETTDNNNTVTYKTSDNKCYNEFEKLVNSGSYKHIEKYAIYNRVINFYESNGFVVELEKISGVLINNQILYAVGYMKKETYLMLKEFR